MNTEMASVSVAHGPRGGLAVMLVLFLVTLCVIPAAAAPGSTPHLGRSEWLERIGPQAMRVPVPRHVTASSAIAAGARTATGAWSDEFGMPGLDGTAICSVIFDRDLVVGGNFHHADGRVTNYIARWDGQEWHAMGAGFSNVVNALTVWRGRLVAGGAFYSSGNTYTGPVAMWNGTEWEALASQLSGGVDALADIDSTLVVGGYFDRIDTLGAGCVASWDGSSWSTMAGGTDGP